MKPATRKAARCMLKSMDYERLSVVLISAPNPKHDDHMVRATETNNPTWYRLFCSQYERIRPGYAKPRTLITRKDTIRGLDELTGNKCKSLYAQRLKDFIESDLETA
ncbi:MAG: hypothetical protein KAJ07_04680 [Planctomycetes bacterium]|nr:hypothetical protein [Planctomycetota bacterium]